MKKFTLRTIALMVMVILTSLIGVSQTFTAGNIVILKVGSYSSGYDAIPGIAGIAGTLSGLINRKLLRIDDAITCNALFSSTAFSGNSPRGGVNSGTDYWASVNSSTSGAK